MKLKRKSGECKYAFVHRIVALAFLDNPDNKEQVHHLDKNPMSAI